MQDPGVPPNFSPLTQRRQERTVYTPEQQQELKKHFAINRYPTYQDRQALADGLNLQEHQVQVWFKNQRAKFSRLRRLSREQGQRRPGVLHSGCEAQTVTGALGPEFDTAFAQVHPPAHPAFPEGPDYSKLGAPNLAPSNVGPVYPGGPDFSNLGSPALDPSAVHPVFPGGPDFSNPGAPVLAPSSVGPVFPGGSDFCQGPPTLGPSPAGPMFPGDPTLYNLGAQDLAPSPAGPTFLEESNFYSPYLPKPSAIFPTAEPQVPSQVPPWVSPVQGVQGSVPSTPAPGPASAPAWSPASYTACFTPESGVMTNFSSVLSSQDPFEGPSSSSSSSSLSGHQEGDAFMAENENDPRLLLNL